LACHPDRLTENARRRDLPSREDSRNQFSLFPDRDPEPPAPSATLTRNPPTPPQGPPSVTNKPEGGECADDVRSGSAEAEGPRRVRAPTSASTASRCAKLWRFRPSRKRSARSLWRPRWTQARRSVGQQSSGPAEGDTGVGERQHPNGQVPSAYEGFTGRSVAHAPRGGLGNEGCPLRLSRRPGCA